MGEDKKIPSNETIYQLSHGDFEAAIIALGKVLGGRGGRIFRRLKDSPRDSGYLDRVARLLINNGVRHCLAWEDAYDVTSRHSQSNCMKVEMVEKILGVKFSDEQKLGPLQRIPYYESTLFEIAKIPGILVPVYPLSLSFLIHKFSRFFENGRDFRKNPHLEGFPLKRKMSCRWLIFTRSGYKNEISDEEFERMQKDPRWTRNGSEELVPELTELVYFCILCRLAAEQEGSRFRGYHWPIARTRDCTPDGRIIGMTFNDGEKIQLWGIRPSGGPRIGDYPLVKPNASSST